MTDHIDNVVTSKSQNSLELERHDQAPRSPVPSRWSHQVRHVRDKARKRSNQLLQLLKARVHVDNSTSLHRIPSDDPRTEIDQNPAFDTSRLHDAVIACDTQNPGGIVGKTIDKITIAGKAITNPFHAAKQTAASKAAISDRPYLSLEADKEYLDAQDEHSALRDAVDEDDNESLFGRQCDQRRRVDQLEDLRDARRVAWITSTNVHRVQVDHRRPIPKPAPEEFYHVDASSGRKRVDIPKYITAWALYLLKDLALNHIGSVDHATHESFDRDLCLRYVERLVIASSPWQAWFLSLRKLYRWENPKRTGTWATIWFFIWWFDYPATFVYGWLVVIVIRSRYQEPSVKAMRESHERSSTDNDGTDSILRFDELLRRHGPSNWIDPLLEAVGPKLQMRLCDLADFLEIMQSFYDWRNPRETEGTLFYLVCAMLLGCTGSRDMTIKLAWMLGLMFFFLGRPIASRYPHYRHSVNALRWIFWNIPTDAEWSLTYLRRKAQGTREALIMQRTQDQMSATPVLDRYIGLVDYSGKHLQDASPAKKAHGDDIGDARSISSADTYLTADSSTSILDGMDMASFKCHSDPKSTLRSSRLIIKSNGLQFVATTRNRLFTRSDQIKDKSSWSIDWLSLLEMRKTQKSRLIVLTSKRTRFAPVRGLEFVFAVRDERCEDLQTDECEDDNAACIPAASEPASRERVVRLDFVEDRDKAFNCIVGFSGLAFRVLEPMDEQWEPKGKKGSQADDKRNEPESEPS